MASKYQESRQLNMPAIEQEWLNKWKEGRFFEKSIEIREGKTPFVFYEGPPMVCLVFTMLFHVL
jgi:isoleucyl-tRNA synthetase